MPRVPLLETSGRREAVGPTLPAPDIRSAGIVASSIAQLGGQIGQLGVELYKRRQKEDLINWGIANKSQWARDEETLKNSLNEQFSGTDFKGYAEEYEKRLGKLKTEYLKRADTDAKKTYFTQQVDPEIGRALIEADWNQRKEHKTYYGIQHTNDIDRIGGDGNYISANKALKDYDLTISHSDMFSNKEKEVFQQRMNQSAYKTVEAMLLNKQYGAASALLDGKDKNNSDEILKRLTPFEQTQLKAKIGQGIKSQQYEMAQKAKMDLINAIKSVDSGELERTDEAVQKAVANSSVLPEDDRLELNAKLAQIDLMNNMQKNMALVPSSERNIDVVVDIMVDEYKKKNTLLGTSIAGTTKQALKDYSAKLDAEFEKNPAEYLYKYDKDIQQKALNALNGPGEYSEYKASMDAHYDLRNIPEKNRSYMNPQFEKYFKEQITNAIEMKPKGAEDLVFKLFSELDDMAGEDSSVLANEMKLDPSYAVIGEIKDPARRRQAIYNQFTPIEDNLYKQTTGKDKKQMDKDSEELSYESYLPDAFAAMGNYSPEAVKNANEIFKTVENEYKRQIIKKVSQNEAMRRAWAMFDDSYHHEHNHKNNYLIPKQNGKPIADPENVSNYLADYMSKYPDEYVKTAHKWVTNGNKTGLTLLKQISGTEEYTPIPNFKDILFSDMNLVKAPPPKSWFTDYVSKRTPREMIGY